MENYEIPQVEKIDTGLIQELGVEIEGKMYDVYCTQINGHLCVIKALRDCMPGSSYYPSKTTVEEVYQVHMATHEEVVKALGEFGKGGFVLPTGFLETEIDGKSRLCNIQRFADSSNQFRVVQRGGSVPITGEFVAFEQRIDFLSRLRDLTDNTGKLLDIDMFIVEDDGAYNIVVFDTTYMYYPKMGWKDRRSFVAPIKDFLFPDYESLTEEQSASVDALVADIIGPIF